MNVGKKKKESREPGLITETVKNLCGGLRGTELPPAPSSTDRLSTGMVVEEVLMNWSNLVETVMQIPQEEVLSLLLYERENARRKQFLIRLYGRFNDLRTKSDREVLCG